MFARPAHDYVGSGEHGRCGRQWCSNHPIPRSSAGAYEFEAVGSALGICEMRAGEADGGCELNLRSPLVQFIDGRVDVCGDAFLKLLQLKDAGTIR